MLWKSFPPCHFSASNVTARFLTDSNDQHIVAKPEEYDNIHCYTLNLVILTISRLKVYMVLAEASSPLLRN